MTYEHILKEIKEPNKRLAQRALQCLVVAVRPLRVEELAEVLAVDFDNAEGIPMLKPDWRWEDQELALLSACSSLIAIADEDVYHGHSQARVRVVQFSHLSVREFLTSSRLATASGDYQIYLEPAHTILAQACVCVLLQIEMHTPEDHPLARYAAEHWTNHAQFGEVSSRLRREMEYLFDANKPHFKVWLTLRDIDTRPYRGATFFAFAKKYGKSPADPLYYAALCGFHDLAKHLITKHLQDVNADGGYYRRPLVAALARGHFQLADLLRHNGADLDVRDQDGRNPLHAAARSGSLEVVRKLIEYAADPVDINARDEGGWKPFRLELKGHYVSDGSVPRFTGEHGPYINVPNDDGGKTPLHWASFNGSLEVVRLLLEHGADAEAKDNKGETALQIAVDGGFEKVVELLRVHGAK